MPWQRCLSHVQQSAIHHCSKVSHRKEVCQDIRDITNGPSKVLAEEMWECKVSKWIECDSKLGEWLEETIPLTMTFFSFPRGHWKKIRTNNLAETFNKEIKRRTRLASLLPNTDSLLLLVSSRAMETSEDWEMIRALIKF
ncbi:transposase [bacterium]|nr:transposase [bacterium]